MVGVAVEDRARAAQAAAPGEQELAAELVLVSAMVARQVAGLGMDMAWVRPLRRWRIATLRVRRIEALAWRVHKHG
jgi:hypothetical protein